MKKWAAKPISAIWLMFAALCGVLAGVYLSSRVVVPALVLPQSPEHESKDGCLLEDEENTTLVYSAALPGIVLVSTVYGPLDENPPKGNGTGFFWDEEGHVVTAFHVVEHAVSIVVHTYDGLSYSATIKGKDRKTDLAVLEITNYQGVPVALALSDKEVVVGQKAIVIGYPLAVESNMGLDRTPSVTTGVISAVDRSIPVLGPQDKNGYILEGILQTDAAINPGNSGGPLLESSGKVAGMVTGVLDWSTGVGFAVPVRVLRDVIPGLVKGGDVTVSIP